MRRGVPSITQYPSPELIEAIRYGGRPRTDDPRWRETGAPDLDAYAEWSVRWCGMACLWMVLVARDGSAPALYELTMGARKYGAYVDEPGRQRGLIYRPFVGYLRDKHGLAAEVITELDPARLTAELDRGRLVIASVHPEIRRPQLDPPGCGGHLVLVTEYVDDQLRFNDPAGHTPATVQATLPMLVFDRFAAHRGIAIQL